MAPKPPAATAQAPLVIQQVVKSRVVFWRKQCGISGRRLAELLGCSDVVVVRAEKGQPIRREYIDKYLALSRGFLKREDFTEARGKEPKINGKTRQQDQGRARGRSGRRRKAV